jgi:hypothetical protein
LISDEDLRYIVIFSQFRAYQVRNGPSGKPLNFRLCDSRGLEDDQGIEPQEMCYILDGHVPEKYVVSSLSQGNILLNIF